MSRSAKDGANLLGLGAVACIACCAGPILALLGGISVAGLASTRFIGGAGLVIAAVAAAAFLVIRRRRQLSDCATTHLEPTSVALTTKDS